MQWLRSMPVVLALLVISNTPAFACTVFVAVDGKVALAGSNEDWADPNTQTWFVLATKENYGIVYFGFGRGVYPPGGGLGWFVQDYRGRKVVLHGGAWGAMVAMIPEEKLGVIVLSNLDLESLPGMLMHDVFDAYLIGSDKAWSQDKWKTWLRNEPPGHAYRPRDEAKARLEKTRTAGTRPSLPVKKYAGVYDSKLYGRLVVRDDGGRLFVTFGGVTTELSHWQGESFYVRSPTRLTFDWLLTFGLSRDRPVIHVTVKHVGWDRDEKDHMFVRGK